MTDGAFGHNCEMGRRNDQKQPSFFNVFIGFTTMQIRHILIKDHIQIISFETTELN
jgi:hypothetical protein